MKRLLTLATVAGAASAFAGVPIYTLDIDSLATGALNGTQGASSITSTGGNAAEVIADPTGAGRNQVIKLSTPIPRDTNGTGNYRRMSGAVFTWDTLGGPKDLVNATWKSITVKFDLYVGPNNFQNLYFGNSNRDTNFGQTVNDGGWLGFGSNTANGTFKSGKWWSVTLDWDKVLGTRAGSFTDGVNTYNTAGTGLSFAADPSTGSAAFYRFNIRTVTDNRPGGPGSLWYVDNVKVSAVPEPASLSVLGLGALALIRRRRNSR